MENYSFDDFENQEKEIQKEQNKILKICDIVDSFSILSKYNSNNSKIQTKVKKICSDFSKIRRIRGDGNCFFRSLLFGIMEYLMNSKNENEINSFIKTVEGILTRLSKTIDASLFEDFHEEFVELVKKMKDSNFDANKLKDNFNNDNLSYHNSSICMLRYLTSTHLKENRVEYEAFSVGGNYLNICNQIERMYHECDSLHIMAIIKELKIDIGIIYLTAQEENYTISKFFKNPKIYMIYRPGHYDLIYK